MDLEKIEGLSDEQKTAIGEMVTAELDGLKAKNAELLTEGKNVKKQNAEFKTQIEELIAFKDEVEESQAAAAGDHKTALERTEKRYKKQIEKLTSERDSVQKQLEAVVLDKGISDELDGLRVFPDLKADLVKIFRSDARIDDGQGVINDQSIKDYLAEWANTDKAKHYIQAQMNNGGGAAGGKNGRVNGTDNPFKSGNRTEQARLIRSNREAAIRMASEAGKRIPGLNA